VGLLALRPQISDLGGLSFGGGGRCLGEDADDAARRSLPSRRSMLLAGEELLADSSILEDDEDEYDE
jgi:hypothetical protein